MENQNNTTKIFSIINKKNKLEKEIECVRKELKEAINNIDAKQLEKCSYEECKQLIQECYYTFNKDKGQELETLIEKKKVEKYPELLSKATYYPEINTLNISDTEKVRLDKTVRKNIRYLIKEKCLSRYGFSVKDIKMLMSLGIIEKFYEFSCLECGDSMTISEKDLENIKRFGH